MPVFVIESEMRYIDEHSHVTAVRSSMAKAEEFVRAQGKVREWRLDKDGNGAFAVVWVGSRRRGSEYLYFIRAFELDGDRVRSA